MTIAELSPAEDYDLDPPMWTVEGATVHDGPSTSESTDTPDDSEVSIAPLVRVLATGEQLPFGQPVRLDHVKSGLEVMVGGDRAGIILRRQTADGPRTSRVAPWWAMRLRRTTLCTVDEKGIARATDDETVDVLVVHGPHVEILEGLTLAQSASLSAIVERSRLGISIPLERADERIAKAVLTTLGARDVTEYRRRMAAAGWLIDGGRAVYLAPIGSVTSDGATTKYEVVEPPKSETGALPQAARQQGWDSLPVDSGMREAAESIRAFLDIFPGSRALGLLLLAQEFGAPLALERRFTLWIKGGFGSGKSQSMSAALAFSSAVGIDGASFHGSLINASPSYIDAMITWARHGVIYLDDAKYDTTDQRVNQARDSTWDEMLRAIYSGMSRGKATQGGGQRAQRTFSSALVVSAEVSPPTGSGADRAITVEVSADQLDLEGADNKFDAFRNQFATTGLARSLKGAYLQWLAARVDDLGFEGFRAENAALRRSLLVEPTTADTGSRRSFELVSIAETGLARLREFLEQYGVDDVLPPADEVRRLLLDARAASSSNAEQASPGRLIVEELASLIGHGRMHVQGAHLPTGEPDAVVRLVAYGWRERSSDQTGLSPSAQVAGTLTLDGRHILVPNDAVRFVKRQLGLSAKAEVTRDELRPFVVSGTPAGGEVPARFGLGRQKGFVFDAKLLGLPGETAPEYRAKFAPDANFDPDEPF